MQLAIPKQFKDQKLFLPGKKAVVLCFEDRLEIRPMNKITESLANSILSEKSLAKDWLTKEDEKAWKKL